MERVKQHLKSIVILVAILLAGTSSVYAQDVVKGVVTDATGEPMVGVTVREQNTNNGVVTDINGNFSLKVKPNSVIQFTYVGYKPLELQASQASGTIVMEENSEQLDEVVVVGYGTQRKVNLSGAVSAIDGDKIAAKPATDVLSALQGEVPGL